MQIHDEFLFHKNYAHFLLDCDCCVVIPPLKRRKGSKDRLARRMPMKRFVRGDREASTENTLRAKVRTCATRRASERDVARRPYRRAVRLCVSEGGCTRQETSLSVVLRGNANGTLPSFSFRPMRRRRTLVVCTRVTYNSANSIVLGREKERIRGSSRSLSPTRRW